MLKETETEETIRFFVSFFHWWHFNWAEVGPLATPMPTTPSVFEKLKNNAVNFTQTWLTITHILVVFAMKTFLKWLWFAKQVNIWCGNYVTYWSNVQCSSVRPVIPHLAALLFPASGNSCRLRTTNLDVVVFPSMLLLFVVFLSLQSSSHSNLFQLYFLFGSSWRCCEWDPCCCHRAFDG